MQYMSHIKMSHFSQRTTITTNPKKKFPILAEIKEETDPISDEVNLIPFHNSIQHCVSNSILCFFFFQIPNQPPPNNEDDPIDLSEGVGSPVRNLPPQAKVSILRRFVIKNELVNL